MEKGHCPLCGDIMRWYKEWGMYICNSWWYMEGGCKTWDDNQIVAYQEKPPLEVPNEQINKD